MIASIIAAAASIVVAIITGIYTVKVNKIKTETQAFNEKSEQRAEQRKQESMLLLRLTQANTKLTVGVAMALKHGHANGEIEDGLQAVEDAEQAYQDFLNQIAMNHLTK